VVAPRARSPRGSSAGEVSRGRGAAIFTVPLRRSRRWVPVRPRLRAGPTHQAHVPEDPPRLGAGGLMRPGARAGDHRVRTLLAVPLGPLVRGLPGHVVPLRRPGDRPAVVDDQLRQPQPGARGQGSVGMSSVRHEDLLVRERNRQAAPLHTGRPSPVTCQIESPHNLDQRDWTSHLGVDPLGRAVLAPLDVVLVSRAARRGGEDHGGEECAHRSMLTHVSRTAL